MTDPLLRVRDLTTRIGREPGAVRPVDGVSFDIRHGETFALLGESGCGKSMTALSIMRLLPPAGRILAGSVQLGDSEVLKLPEYAMREVRGGRMAMIFQEPMTSLNPVMSVCDQILEALHRHERRNRDVGERRVVELLKAVGIPDPALRAREYPHQLSGGMKQRVMIAMALAGQPELLIADEPTTALDVTIQAQVLGLLKRLQRDTGMAILLITHDLGVVAETADHVAVMYAGQVVEVASVERFFAAARHPYSARLFESLPDMDKRARPLAVIPGTVPPLNQAFSGCRFASRCDAALAVCRDSVPEWYTDESGHAVRCHLYAPGMDATAARPAAVIEQIGQAAAKRVSASTLLEVEQLKVHFPIRRGMFKRVVGQVRAVDDLSLTIGEGRTLALVGESGCGKTTVGKGILRLLPLTAGAVRFKGEDLAGLSPSALRRHRADSQIIFQDPFSSMNPRMLIRDIIEEGMLAQGIGSDREDRRQRIEALLRQVGLTEQALPRYPHEFSGGQRQRICIARALAVNPRLIICDEPTSALDVSVQAQILNLLKDLQDRLGLAYLFITHDISVVAYLAHEVAVMYLGRIVERGTVQEVLDDPQHPYTRALLSAVPVPDPGARHRGAEADQHHRRVIRLEGDMPSPANPPAGCHFHPRCPQAMADCQAAYPGETRLSETRSVRCLLVEGDQA